MLIACIISFIIGAMLMLCVMGVVSNCKGGEPRNKVRFYVARDKNTLLYLYLGKPKRSYYSFTPCKNGYCFMSGFQKFGLNPDDFSDLKWEDEPVEVFLNLNN